MLKIKGLKKKKKGKKSKHKEEELFEAAELEEYRKEQQRKQEELKEKGQTHEDDEEWKKFKQLTSGVDDILKKTQGDLDRIKSTSYFQKKAPGPSDPGKSSEKKSDRPVRPPEPVEKKWVGFEEGDSSLTVEVTEDKADPQGEAAEGEFKPEVFTEEEESEEEDDLDDLFDTSYVDAVESGEVVLAYIPESPTEEDDSGYDPFDTSIVDKVISIKDQKKALVTLGSAVEVLSGKVDKPVVSQDPTPFKTSKRRRPRPQDLLLGSFDESSQHSVSPAQIIVEPAPKSILDDDPIFEEQTSETLGYAPVTPITEILPAVTQEPKKKESGINIKNLVDEFVSPVTPATDLQSLQLVTEVVNTNDDFDDEFAALAAESLSKEKDVVQVKRPPRPAPPGAGSRANDLDDLDNEGNDDDPFDTTFADKVLPGKYELKLIEKEVLHDHVQIDTTNIVQNKINEVLKNSDLTININKTKFKETFEDDDFKLLSPSQRDLLGGSTTDLSTIGHHPIQPETASTKNSDVIHYSDPFDTSVIDSIVAPKKTELKYLEQELLADKNITNSVVSTTLDDDFNPRAEESKPLSRPDSLVVGSGKRVSVPKIVAFDVKSECGQDLLAVDQEESSKIPKPLTPYYTDKNIVDDKLTSESDIDPFDTSFVKNCPGKVELKLLENELVGNNDPKVDLSDPDFDPRGEKETINEEINNTVEELRPDIISEEVSTDIKLHTPVVPRKFEEDLKKEEDIDPFDTSIVNSLVPGRVEIKILEKELIESGNTPIHSSDNSSQVVRNLLEKAKKQSTSSDTDLLAQVHDDDTSKPLTPIPADFSVEDEDYDPFDTSGVENILPGKTEIKLLESELLN